MALDQSDLTALAAALTSSDGADLVRDAVRLVFQELIEAEAAQVIALFALGRGERTTGDLDIGIHR